MQCHTPALLFPLSSNLYGRRPRLSPLRSDSIYVTSPSPLLPHAKRPHHLPTLPAAVEPVISG